MNFEEAVQAMKQGNKVRRKDWDIKRFIFKGVTGKFEEIEDYYSMGIIDFEADDWEILEETKTLSDKIENTDKGICNKSDYIYVEDIKEFIQQLKEKTVEELSNDNIAWGWFIELIDELAGEQLK